MIYVSDIRIEIVIEIMGMLFVHPRSVLRKKKRRGPRTELSKTQKAKNWQGKRSEENNEKAQLGGWKKTRSLNTNIL